MALFYTPRLHISKQRYCSAPTCRRERRRRWQRQHMCGGPTIEKTTRACRRRGVHGIRTIGVSIAQRTRPIGSEIAPCSEPRRPVARGSGVDVTCLARAAAIQRCNVGAAFCRVPDSCAEYLREEDSLPEIKLLIFLENVPINEVWSVRRIRLLAILMT